MGATATEGPTIEIGELRFRPLIESGTLQRRVGELGIELASVYKDRLPMLVGVLSGAAAFHADLTRAMEIPLTVDFLRVASYGDGLKSSGKLDFTAECGTPIAGRNVIIVEDIVDTGRTVRRLREYFHENGAASVVVATLLYKRDADIFGNPPEFIGFEIADRFVVGFGLDYKQEGRNLRHIYVLDEAP